ncbi:MAG: hypothetical protein B6244_10445 [Candidatus Cloacimonetes bacterium 4572_55]|nr:MAG: hypothetical protein B6244_10445 [Candidatus Cloacimonetes bacterium 4572_55]
MRTKTDFLDIIKKNNPRLKIDQIERAYDLASELHADQMRKSGEPYLSHLLEVGEIVARLGLDTDSVSAGILHDIVEDADISVEEIHRSFGAQVSTLVQGLTKIKGVKFKSYHEKQADYYRRLLLTMAEDVRVIIIKLADRLHNMRTLKYHDSVEKQRRIAQETMDIYAPLAHRFGLAEIKWELEDLSFKHLDRRSFDFIKSKLERKRPARERYVADMIKPLLQIMAENHIRGEVSGRPKHIYSIYKKMTRQGKSIEQLDDLYAFRIIIGANQSFVRQFFDDHAGQKMGSSDKKETHEKIEELRRKDRQREQEEISQLYSLLGVIHQRFPPIPGAFDDYVASPKSNGYQSLHTTVIGREGKKTEIQIRTYDMHRVAELGIAAHWRYKERSVSDKYLENLVPWVRELLTLDDDSDSSTEFLDLLKKALTTKRIILFTPRGEIVQMQENTTPIDFAFAIHTEVGLRCRGAKVNGRMVTLNYRLNKGDCVEIITYPKAKPTRGWLDIAKSSKAKSKIRKALREQEFQQNLALGRDKLTRELKTRHIDLPKDKKLSDLLADLKCASLDNLHEAIGSGKQSISPIIKRLAPQIEREEQAIEEIAEEFRRQSTVVIDGVDNVMMRIASCCQPVPGDDAVGFITRGRGISIHLRTCANISHISKHQKEDSNRLVNLTWGLKESRTFLSQIYVEGKNRRDMLANIIQTIFALNIHIRKNETVSKGKQFFGRFLLEVQGNDQLIKVIKKLGKLDGIHTVGRERMFKSK